MRSVRAHPTEVWLNSVSHNVDVAWGSRLGLATRGAAGLVSTFHRSSSAPGFAGGARTDAQQNAMRALCALNVAQSGPQSVSSWFRLMHYRCPVLQDEGTCEGQIYYTTIEEFRRTPEKSSKRRKIVQKNFQLSKIFGVDKTERRTAVGMEAIGSLPSVHKNSMKI